MACVHGTSDVIPHPSDFRDDEELRVYLGLPNTERGRAILASVTPEQRREYASLRATERMLMKGHIPRGVIACSRGRQSRG